MITDIFKSKSKEEISVIRDTMNFPDRMKFCLNHKSISKYGAWILECLPKINGVIISSIWSSYDLIDDEDELDDIFSYDKWSYHSYFSDKNFRSVIHPEIKKLFGWQIINGKRVLVKHISLRDTSSGHADPDSIATIYVKDNSISVYDTNNLEYFTNKTSSIHYTDPYFQKVVRVLIDKEYNVEWYNRQNTGYEDLKKPNTLRQSQYLRHSSSSIRYIDNLVYPDEFFTSWCKGHPYVSNNNLNKDNIRVWFEPQKVHLYLTKATEPEYGIIYVNTLNEKFCLIRYYNNGNIDIFDPSKYSDKELKKFHLFGYYKIIRKAKSIQYEADIT